MAASQRKRMLQTRIGAKKDNYWFIDFDTIVYEEQSQTLAIPPTGHFPRQSQWCKRHVDSDQREPLLRGWHSKQHRHHLKIRTLVNFCIRKASKYPQSWAWKRQMMEKLQTHRVNLEISSIMCVTHWRQQKKTYKYITSCEELALDMTFLTGSLIWATR